MLSSMTGFGKAQITQEGYAVGCEIKTVNNRYLTFNTRMPENYAAFCAPVEALIRQKVRRGSVFVNLKVDPVDAVSGIEVDLALARHYAERLRDLGEDAGMEISVDGSALLALPGVVREPAPNSARLEKIWSLAEGCLKKALEELAAMRCQEGRRLAGELERLLKNVSRLVEKVAAETSGIVEDYRKKLAARIQTLLAGSSVSLSQADLAREVSIYADRSDVSEELVRLRSHVEQFREAFGSDEAVGRRMEFIVQEMFREANTIGSKALDARMANTVLDLKGEIEKIKEQTMNVE